MDNFAIFRLFNEGGFIMWPMLATSLVALTVIVERCIWWVSESRKRDLLKLDQVFSALEKRDIKKASNLSGGSKDAILRVLWYGFNHSHSSLQGAMQVSAGIELERAGRFIPVLDTIVTLAPLLGLLGTVTGLMKAFFRLGDAELSEQAVTGGIAEALIATACGLAIAVVSLIFLNYFSSRLAKFQFELQTACSNAEVLLGVPAVPHEVEPVTT